MMRAVAYARVSSAAQRDRDTIASQLRVLPAFIQRQGWTLARPIDTYVDDGRTAKAGHLEARTGLTALLRDAAAGVFDVVVTVNVDRITRSEDLTERGAILGAFQRAGVKLADAATGQVLDLSTSLGDLYSSLQVFFAAEENRKRRERTREGKITAARRGRKSGGPTPYGLDYDRDAGVWSINPVTGPIVVEIYERVASGEPCSAIAEDLERRGIPRPRGRWQGHRVWQIARSRHAAGEWVADKLRQIVVPVPRIVTDAQWNAAQDALLAHKKRGLRRTKHVYLLEGLARCGFCGQLMLIRSPCGKRLPDGTSASKPAYVCRARKLKVRQMARCTAPIVLTSDADARLWAKLAELVADPSAIEAAFASEIDLGNEARDWASDADTYRRMLRQSERAESALLERFGRGMISEKALDIELMRMKRDRGKLGAKLRDAESCATKAASARDGLENALAMLGGLRPAIEDAPVDLRRELVHKLLRPGSVTFDGFEIQFVVGVPRAGTASRASRGATGAGPALALADALGSFSVGESRVEIRLVA